MKMSHSTLWILLFLGVMPLNKISAILAYQPGDTITTMVLIITRKKAPKSKTYKNQWFIKGTEVVCVLKDSKQKYRGVITGFKEGIIFLKDKAGNAQTIKIADLSKIRRKRKLDKAALKKSVVTSLIGLALSGIAIWAGGNNGESFITSFMVFMIILSAVFAFLATIWYALIALAQLVFKKKFKLGKKWEAKIESRRIYVRTDSKGVKHFSLTK